MKFYFIRHAPTYANKSGIMVNGYENADIDIHDKPDDWEERVGHYIPEEARRVIISSPTRRCLSTSKMLFGRYPDEVTEALGEFDCKNLGNRKFWEISEEEFNSLVYLPSSTMAKRANEILTDVGNLIKKEHNTDSVVAISHGMIIRYLYHYITGHPDVSAYDIINSKGYAFSNLDLLVADVNPGVCNLVFSFHYSKPMERK